MPIHPVLFVMPYPSGGLCYWLTDSMAKEDDGYSCAGLIGIADVIEEIEDLKGSDTRVVDLTSMSIEKVDTIMHTETSRRDRISADTLPVDTWLANQT